MKTITKIEANRSAAVYRKCRVAAYCRVSTEHDDQIESLGTQKEHYAAWIKLHIEWESAGIFYDAGITGTKAEIRPGLQDLLQACRMGRVDRILVKSISRFSRNTAECLALVRELSGIGVSVFFEKENIDTGSMESELFLTILSSMAEEESLSISRNEKWSVQHRFQNGTYVSSSFPYGYCRNDRGEMGLEPEEAEIVKYIFSALLSGKSSCQIADLLEQQEIPFKNGRHWCDAAIRGIAGNEKYVGDVLLQKTYTDAHFHRHKNHGEVECYLLSDHHIPIVSRETFSKANAVIRQRAAEKGIVCGTGKYQKRYAFSGKVICGKCGSTCKRRIHSGNEIAWTCAAHIESAQKCPMKYVREDILKAAFVTMLNKLIFSRKHILKPLLEQLKANSNDENVRRMQELQKQLESHAEKKNTLHRLYAQKVIDPVLFRQEMNALQKQAESCRMEIAQLEQETHGETEIIAELKLLLQFTEQHSAMLTEFQETWFSAFAEQIILYDRNHIGFRLKCGLLLKEEI